MRGIIFIALCCLLVFCHTGKENTPCIVLENNKEIAKIEVDKEIATLGTLYKTLQGTHVETKKDSLKALINASISSLNDKNKRHQTADSLYYYRGCK